MGPADGPRRDAADPNRQTHQVQDPGGSQINEPTSVVAPGVRGLRLEAGLSGANILHGSACQAGISGSSFAEPPGGFRAAEPEPWAGPIGLELRPKASPAGPDRCLRPMDPSLVTIPTGPPGRRFCQSASAGRDGVPTALRDGSLSPSPTQPAPRQSAPGPNESSPRAFPSRPRNRRSGFEVRCGRIRRGVRAVNDFLSDNCSFHRQQPRRGPAQAQGTG